jgi:hypothetical protein
MSENFVFAQILKYEPLNCIIDSILFSMNAEELMRANKIPQNFSKCFDGNLD